MLSRVKERFKILVIFLLLAFLCTKELGFNKTISEIKLNQKNNTQIRLKLRYEYAQNFKTLIRDFFYYECKDKRRIGGIKKTKNKLERIDGAWYVCFDKYLAPVTNKCTILSFGINLDESFDYAINKMFNCTVHSFDPYIESDRFQEIRNSNPKLKNSFKIEVNDKWTFYRIGITGSATNVKKRKKIGWIATLKDILYLLDLNRKVIDVFKMDIEWFEDRKLVGGEIDVLANFDVNYACKYFKQFLLETHSPNAQSSLLNKLLKRLDKCFSLFHRDTRFITPGLGGDVFSSAARSGFKLRLDLFGNEVALSNFLISTGELYFINENYLLDR